MVRLRDSRSGVLRELPRGVLRLQVRLPSPSPDNELDRVRLLVTADVLRRAVEVAGTQVLEALVADEAGEELEPTYREFCIEPPFAVLDTAADVAEALLGSAVVELRTADVEPSPAVAASVVVGPVASLDDLSDVDLSDVDPLAVRWLLLATPYGKELRLDPAQLAAAGTFLQRLRRLVAACAGSPSAPLPLTSVTAAVDALNDDLDTLALVRAVEEIADDSTLDDGAKFEALVYLDRILGVELTRALRP